MSTLLTLQTAVRFPECTSDGFAKPHLAWSAFGPEHLEHVLASSMTSNVWLGKPTEMKAFLEEIAKHYESMKNEADPDEYDGVSVAYWEKDGVAMGAAFCTGDAFFEKLSDYLNAWGEDFNLLLCEGNDNDPGHILKNKVVQEELDVATRLLLAHFMTPDAAWVLDPLLEPPPEFTSQDVDTLRAILMK